MIALRAHDMMISGGMTLEATVLAAILPRLAVPHCMGGKEALCAHAKKGALMPCLGVGRLAKEEKVGIKERVSFRAILIRDGKNHG